MSGSKAAYHHGDLRAACVRAAMELLEEGGQTSLSLRAVARRAGVSPAAPYRHFADREALVSAVAAGGYRELGEGVVGSHPYRCTFVRASAEAFLRLTPRRWPPRSGRSSTGLHSCSWTASSMPAPRRP